jgi:8-oxo-dGTP pyrophosphatase MutT (NUDIX family)
MGNVPVYFYIQSAVIPCRWQDGRLDILMITSRKKKRWVIPKGVKEPELSAADSAAQEALEEAGIKGTVFPAPVGEYSYEKWGGRCTVQVFVMAVETVLPVWQESYRDREWVSLEEAHRRVTEQGLKKILTALPGQLEEMGVRQG